jgi:hypothetical protein
MIVIHSLLLFIRAFSLLLSELTKSRWKQVSIVKQRFFGVYNFISEKLKAQVRPAFLASKKYDVKKPVSRANEVLLASKATAHTMGLSLPNW